MLRGRFYELIESARAGAEPSSPSADPAVLRNVLLGLSDTDLAGFAATFEDELVRMNRWDLWGVGYVAQGGLSDDGFHYFRSWLIGKGRWAVDAVLDEPDSLADFLDEDDCDNELLEYVAVHLLKERGLPDARDVERRAHADDAPVGEPFQEDLVESDYPRTAARARVRLSEPLPPSRPPTSFWRRLLR